MILGGYGAVGKHIATELAKIYPNQIIVAGRNGEKASSLASALNNTVIPLAFDLDTLSENDARLNDVAILIMCIEARNAPTTKQCAQRGIHYLDTSASYDYLKEIERLHNSAEKGCATFLLSAGIVPGLSNLLVKHCVNTCGNRGVAEIYVLLGLGEAHGEAAIHWSIEQMNAEYVDSLGNRTKSFANAKQTAFPGDRFARNAYQFNFSDQHVLPHTLSISSATTRLCFESRFITALFYFMSASGIGKVLKLPFARNAMTYCLQKFRFGTDRFSVKVVYRQQATDGATFSCSITGHEEARITGITTALLAHQMMKTDYPHGVFHIEQLFEPMKIINDLNQHGIQFEQTNMRFGND